MWLRSAIATSVAAVLGACAIHPLPDDVTGVSTEVIVKRVRCEARAGLKNAFLTFLRNKGESVGGDELANILDRTDTPKWPEKLQTFARRNLANSSDLGVNWLSFAGGAIAYDFTFDMTEMNNIDPTLKAIKADPSSATLLGATGSADRTRHSIRDFSIADNFSDLLKLRDTDCADQIVTANYVYPIVGEIGLREMMTTFVQLWLMDHVKFTGKIDAQIKTTEAKLAQKTLELSKTNQFLESERASEKNIESSTVKPRLETEEVKQAKAKAIGLQRDLTDLQTTLNSLKDAKTKAEAATTPAATKSSPVITDTFEFTTSWSSTVSPELQFSSIKHLVRITDVAFPFTNSRKDVHKVVVGLATSDAPASKNITASLDLLGNRGALSSAQQAAAVAVANHILRFEVLPRVTIIQ